MCENLLRTVLTDTPLDWTDQLTTGAWKSTNWSTYLAGAQQAFATLESSFHHSGPQGPASAPVVPVGSGPEIVLNLSNGSNATTPEQITINISNLGNGSPEQVSFGLPTPALRALR